MVEGQPKAIYVQRTSKVVTQHSDRNMKSYQVLEGELNQISMLNHMTTAFSSAATLCATIAVGLWSNIFVSVEPSREAKEFGTPIQFALLVTAFVFAVLSIWMMCNRRSMVNRIKRESGGG